MEEADSGVGWTVGANVVISFGLLLRFALLHEAIGEPPWWLNFLEGVDTYTHLEMARSILADPWQSGLGSFYQSPLYPYVLAGLQRALGTEPARLAYAQGAMSALAALVTARTARAMLGARAGCVAAVLMSFSAQAIFYPLYFLPAVLEMLVAALTLATIAGAVREGGRARWAWAGAACGLAWVARPNIAAAGAVVALAHAVLARARGHGAPGGAKAALAFACSAALVVAPLVVRNLRAGGGIGLLPTSGEVNFKIGNSEDSLVAGFTYPQGKPLELFSFALVRHQLAKLVVFFWGYEIPQNVNFYLVRDASTVLSMPLLGLEVLVGLAAVGLAAWRRPGVPVVTAWLAAYAASIAAFFVVGRFRLPALPALAILGAAAFLELRERLAAGRYVPAGALMTLAAALTVASGTMPERPIRINDYLNVMQGAWGRTRPSQIRDVARRAAKEYPALPDVRALYAATLVDANDRAALPEIEAALRMDPRNARALLSLLAWNVRNKGDPRTIEAIRAELVRQGVQLPR